MTLFFTVLHVVVCIVLIVVVLLQRGKGAEAGAMFGGGGAGTMFGSRGAGNFLTRLTSAAATVFMITSLTLAYFAQEDTGSTLFEGDETATESPFAEPEASTETGSEGSAFEDVTPPQSGAEEGSAFGEVPTSDPGEAPPAEPGSDAGMAPVEPEAAEPVAPEPEAATP